MPATPDTSAKNVARVLRECAPRMPIHTVIKGIDGYPQAEIRALADALEQREGPTWEEMCDRLAEKLGEMLTSADGYGSIPRRARVIAPSILRHVLPELAPPSLTPEPEN